MNRRTFLRVLGSAAVGAAVAQVLPAIVPAASGPSPWWRSQFPSASASPPLTAAMMRQTYENCSIGGIRPSYFVTDRATYESYARLCGLVYDFDFTESRQ